jgi:hypothetical protein
MLLNFKRGRLEDIASRHKGLSHNQCSKKEREACDQASHF